MASLIDELIDTLQKEYEVYQQLVPIVEQKTQVIVKNDLISLQEITGKEQAAVDQISMLEHRRETVMRDIKTVINRKNGDLNLQTLIKLISKQPKEQKALETLHDNLKRIIQRLVYANNRNKSLIKHSLEMIEFNMNFIQSTRMIPGNNYTRGASQYMMQTPGTGMFDAKQ